ncbi:LOW QUALITY PROTEIN: hypothetical protein T265_13408, partial [Opisthorchis viverrini]
MVLGRRSSLGMDELLTLHRLRRSGHVLCMPEDRLPHRALSPQPCAEWKRPRGEQCMTWQQGTKTLTSSLNQVGNHRLPGWGPQNLNHQWLMTLEEMAQSGSQWSSCIKAIAFNVYFISKQTERNFASKAWSCFPLFLFPVAENVATGTNEGIKNKQRIDKFNSILSKSLSNVQNLYLMSVNRLIEEKLGGLTCSNESYSIRTLILKVRAGQEQLMIVTQMQDSLPVVCAIICSLYSKTKPGQKATKATYERMRWLRSKSANLLTGRSVVRIRPPTIDSSCLGFGNLVVSQPLCFLLVMQLIWNFQCNGVMRFARSTCCKSSNPMSITQYRLFLLISIWSMKEITKCLGAAGAISPRGWGLRDPHCAWLETLQDMTVNRCQLLLSVSIHNLTFVPGQLGRRPASAIAFDEGRQRMAMSIVEKEQFLLFSFARFYEFVFLLSRMGIVLIYFYICDRTTMFGKTHKDPESFWLRSEVLCLTVLGLLFIRRSKHTDFNNLDVTREWKGWMQIYIVTYHYVCGQSVVSGYMSVRYLVSAYLFLTAYGHTCYFWRKYAQAGGESQ